jgi:molecular chaperone GrpE
VSENDEQLASDRDYEAGEASRGFKVSDNRRVDPVTGEPRPNAAGVDAEVAEANADDGVFDELVAGELLLLKQLEERTADLQRVHAEYANYRKRVERDRDEVRRAAQASVVEQLLPVLDDFGRADEHGELVGSFKTVADSFLASLTRVGLKPFGAVGDDFDPQVHEALTVVEDPTATSPKVATVYQAGYLFGDKVLRPARVVVAQAPHDTDTGAQ